MNQLQSPVILIIIHHFLLRILITPETSAPDTRTLIQMIRLQGCISRLQNVVVQSFGHAHRLGADIHV